MIYPAISPIRGGNTSVSQAAFSTLVDTRVSACQKLRFVQIALAFCAI
ncbi:hypothetical protein BH10ACI1_BH10ACI1_08840 [soil metagenome]